MDRSGHTCAALTRGVAQSPADGPVPQLGVAHVPRVAVGGALEEGAGEALVPRCSGQPHTEQVGKTGLPAEQQTTTMQAALQWW